MTRSWLGKERHVSPQYFSGPFRINPQSSPHCTKSDKSAANPLAGSALSNLASSPAASRWHCPPDARCGSDVVVTADRWASTEVIHSEACAVLDGGLVPIVVLSGPRPERLPTRSVRRGRPARDDYGDPGPSRCEGISSRALALPPRGVGPLRSVRKLSVAQAPCAFRPRRADERPPEFPYRAQK